MRAACFAERDRDVGEVVARAAVLVHVAAGEHRDLVDRAQDAERAGPLAEVVESRLGLRPRPARGGGALAGPPRDDHRRLAGGDRHRGLPDDAATRAAAEPDLREVRDVAEADGARDVDLAVGLHRERREPVDLRRRDAGVVERERHRLARERQLGVGEALAERGLPDADDRGAVLDQLGRHQPFHSGLRRSRNDATPSPESTVWLFISTSIASSSRRSRRDNSLASWSSFLAQPIAMVGPLARRSAHSFVVASRSVGGHDLVDDADALGVGRAQVVAEEHELLRLVQTDDARKEVGDAAVGHEPATHEHLNDLRGVGRDHEVGREHEHRAAARGGAVEGDDDRLLAVEHRLHEPLETEAHHLRRGADDHLGRAVGLRLARGLAHREVGAGAEVPLARAGEHDRAHLEVGVRLPEVLREAVADVIGDRVALVGAIDRQPEHAVLDLGDQFFLDVHAVGHRIEGMQCHARTTNASRATAPCDRPEEG